MVALWRFRLVLVVQAKGLAQRSAERAVQLPLLRALVVPQQVLAQPVTAVRSPSLWATAVRRQAQVRQSAVMLALLPLLAVTVVLPLPQVRMLAALARMLR